MNSMCPICRGHKFVIDPRKVIDGKCLTCDGTGNVNIEFRCQCGRPAVRNAATQLVCTDERCTNKVLKAMY